MENKTTMTTNRTYPAIFHKEDDGYWVEFPDVPGCFTQGKTLEEAFKMAKEALALGLDGEPVKSPTPLEEVVTEGNDRAMLVEADNGDDIVYFKNSEVPRAIETGLEKRGFTKYQVAQILGVDRAYISRIAKGERVPSVDMAKRIATLLDFDWRVFYADGTGTL